MDLDTLDFAKNGIYFNHNEQPGIANTSGFDLIDVAISGCNFNILKIMEEKHAHLISENNLERIKKYCELWQIDEADLQKKLTTRAIPVPTYSVIERDQCKKIIKKSDIEFSNANLHELAEIYATLIATHPTEGKKLIERYESWATLPIFRSCVFRHIYTHLEEHLRYQAHIVPENVARLMAMRNLSSQPLDKYERVFFDYLTHYCAYYAKQDRTWNDSFEIILRSLFNKNLPSELFKDTCHQLNAGAYPRFYVQNFKSAFHQYILKRSIVRGIEKPTLEKLALPIPLIHEIIAHFKPDQESFIKFKNHLAQDFTVKK